MYWPSRLPCCLVDYMRRTWNAWARYFDQRRILSELVSPPFRPSTKNVHSKGSWILHTPAIWKAPENIQRQNALWTVFILQLRVSSILVISDNHTRFVFRFLSVLILLLLIPIILPFIYVKGAEATGQLLMSMSVQLTLAEYIYIHTYKTVGK